MSVDTKQAILAPENVTVNVTSATSCHVQWLSVSHNHTLQSPYNYTLEWESTRYGKENVTVGATSYNLQGLVPFTTYGIRVAAVDGVHNGTFSNTVWFQTPEAGRKLSSFYPFIESCSSILPKFLRIKCVFQHLVPNF